MPAAEFDAGSRARRRRRRAPSNEPERRGQIAVPRGRLRRLPCGPRHRGDGTIGPDLTHLGGRRSVGIDTLPLTPRTSRASSRRPARQARQPHARFRIFAADELDALAAYLLSLR